MLKLFKKLEKISMKLDKVVSEKLLRLQEMVTRN